MFCTANIQFMGDPRYSFRIPEAPKNRINIDDPRYAQGQLHNFRVTRLWMACTPLIKQQLQNR